MAAEDVDGAETSRTVVKTYVPEYQKAEWTDHADELDMTQSEFVRTMVQAGRRGFLDDETTARDDPPDGDDVADDSDSTDEGNGDESVASNGADLDIAERAFQLIAAREPVDWDDLYDELVADVERELDESLQELQAQNRITHSGREGGYVAVEDDAS